jgi:hypothetical protein
VINFKRINKLHVLLAALLMAATSESQGLGDIKFDLEEGYKAS